MRFNQYSFIKKEDSIYLQELASLGFHLNPNASNKENLETFVRKCSNCLDLFQILITQILTTL